VDRRRENHKLKLEKIPLKDMLFIAGGHEIEKENGHFVSHSGWKMELASNYSLRS
jgi:hypothetical protein